MTPNQGLAWTAPGSKAVELVMTWGVDDLPALDRVLSLGVNGVISNDAEVLRAVTARRS